MLKQETKEVPKKMQEQWEKLGVSYNSYLYKDEVIVRFKSVIELVVPQDTERSLLNERHVSKFTPENMEIAFNIFQNAKNALIKVGGSAGWIYPSLIRYASESYFVVIQSHELGINHANAVAHNFAFLKDYIVNGLDKAKLFEHVTDSDSLIDIISPVLNQNFSDSLSSIPKKTFKELMKDRKRN